MTTFNLIEAVLQAQKLNTRFRPVGNTEWMYLHGTYICEAGNKYHRDVPFNTKAILARYELEALVDSDTHTRMSRQPYQTPEEMQARQPSATSEN